MKNDRWYEPWFGAPPQAFPACDTNGLDRWKRHRSRPLVSRSTAAPDRRCRSGGWRFCRNLPEELCQTACKPGSVRAVRETTIPLGRALLHASRDQPGRQGGNAPASPIRLAPDGPPAAPIRSCSRWGLPCRPCHQGRGALLPHRFTLAGSGCPMPAVCFLWHCPWGRPRRRLAGTVFPWSPDFPPSPLGIRANPDSATNSGRPAVWPGGDALP